MPHEASNGRPVEGSEVLREGSVAKLVGTDFDGADAETQQEVRSATFWGVDRDRIPVSSQRCLMARHSSTGRTRPA